MPKHTIKKKTMFNKRTFDLIFIAASTIFVLLAISFIDSEKYVAFSLIPIFVAFFAGQYSGKKYLKESKAKNKKRAVSRKKT